MSSAACGLVFGAVVVGWAASAQTARPAVAGSKALVAHRGASAYAPEHTLAAYTLALTQGADYVEQDLAVTKDGVLVCIHDLTLERTTDVEAVFPTRFDLLLRMPTAYHLGKTELPLPISTHEDLCC